MPNAPRRVAVLGAGITGLAVAYRITHPADATAAIPQVTLIDGSRRPGGALATSREDGFLLEQGPDSFLTVKPEAARLCEEIGLGSSLIGTNPEHRRSFVVRDGKLVPVSEGFYLLAPSSLISLWRSPLFTLRGKLRMAMEPFIKARRDPADESLESFVVRRLGREALERLAQPMIGGITTADPSKLSLKATFPQFLDMEREHGSVIRALALKRRAAGPLQESKASGPRYGLFATIVDGMESFVEKLARSLPKNTLQLGKEVTGLSRQSRADPWEIRLKTGDSVPADHVVMALPAPHAAKLLGPVDQTLASDLAGIAYASTATVNIACRRDQVSHALNGMGFVVPDIEQRFIIACTFSSVKFLGRAPADHTLLRAFVGGALHPERLALDDREIVARTLADLRPFVGLSGEPRFARVHRHPTSLAQYHVGHLDLVARIEAAAQKIPDLSLAGNYLGGGGIPDCIRSAGKAVERLRATF